MNLESIIRKWPPAIDWNLLDSCFDSAVPRRFLKEESWKLLLAKSATLEENRSGETALKLPVYVPQTIVDQALDWLCLMLQADIRKELSQTESSIDLSSLSIEFVEAVEELDPERLNALSTTIRDRQLEHWLRLYVKGLHFASEIGRPGQERYVFIQEVFIPTDEFEQTRQLYEHQYQGPVLLTGIPRSGKTYTALRLLYEVLENADASVKLINHWADPRTLVDALEEAKEDGINLFAVLDDPFGVDEYSDEAATTVVEILRDVVPKHPRARLLITSREEVYQAALRHHQDLEQLLFSKVPFTPEKIKTDARSYPEMLERTAWLHGANWRKELKPFISETEATEEAQTELTEAWRTVLEKSYVPGVLLSAFILYPEIAELDIKDPPAVRTLALLLNKAVDVAAAFRSELETLLEEAKPQQVFYLLLPSLTLVQDETLQALFTADELTSLRKKLERYFEQAVGDDFSVYSYRYKLDIFAEVAQQLLVDDGPKLLESSILPELQKRISLQASSRSAEVLADVLSRYFWLGGGIGNQYVVSLLQSFRKQEVSSAPISVIRERDRVYVLGALFQRGIPKLGYDLLIKKLITADPLLVSNVASLLDQLLTTHSRYRQKELLERISSVVGMLLKEYFTSPEAEESALHASLLLHGVLSHLENYFISDEEIDLSEVQSPNEFIGSHKINNEMLFNNLLGNSAVIDRINEGKSHWMLPALMWIDAIIMKLGELRLYLVRHKRLADSGSSSYPSLAESTDPQFANLPTEILAEIQACVVLYRRLLNELETVTELSQRTASGDEQAILMGGLHFTLAWHNRWCLTEQRDGEINKIALWADNFGFSREFPYEENHWKGIYFNLRYHARYFETKASAWQRESAIYRPGNVKAPRLGADSPHESGLPSAMLRKDWSPRFSSFFTECINRVMPEHSESYGVPEDVARSACLLLGMRAPRDSVVEAVYISRIRQALQTKECPWREYLWNAVAKLFAFNLRDPMEMVKRAIELVRDDQSARNACDSFLEVIAQVEAEFQESGARYALRSLNSLKTELSSL